MFTEIIAGIIAFFGVIIGVFLSYIAPEELIPAKSYLRVAKRISFALFCASTIVYLLGVSAITIAISLFLIFAIGVTRHVNMSKTFYYLMAALLVLTTIIDKQLFFVCACITFFYGMTITSLYLKNHIKNEKMQTKFWPTLQEVSKRYYLFIVIFFLGIVLKNIIFF